MLLIIDCWLILLFSFINKDLFKFLNKITNNKPKQNSKLAKASKKKVVQNNKMSSFKQLVKTQ